MDDYKHVEATPLTDINAFMKMSVEDFAKDFPLGYAQWSDDLYSGDVDPYDGFIPLRYCFDKHIRIFENERDTSRT